MTISRALACPALPFTLITALAAAGCGAVAEDAAPDAAPAEDAASIPLHCGNHAPDPGEDCDGTPGCTPMCHVAPAPGTVAVRFRGVVSRVEDPHGLFGTELRVDMPLWGRVVYPTSLGDTSADPAVGAYPYDNAGVRGTRGIWLSVALWSFHPDRGTGVLSVQNGTENLDRFSAQLGNGVVTPPIAGLQQVVVALIDPTQAAFGGDALPRTAFPPTAAWSSRHAYIQGSTATGVTWQVEAELDDVSFETPAP